jgi:hypothetical protein
MAKAKKDSSTGAQAAGARAGGPGKAGGKKEQAAKTPDNKPATPATDPAIFVDTNLAASSAARLLAARAAAKPAEKSASAKPESAMFKQLKDGLQKPAGQTMSNLLDKHIGTQQKRSAAPQTGPRPVGRNQTFGADVNRTGVPRRTGGG